MRSTKASIRSSPRFSRASPGERSAMPKSVRFLHSFETEFLRNTIESSTIPAVSLLLCRFLEGDLTRKNRGSECVRLLHQIRSVTVLSMAVKYRFLSRGTQSSPEREARAREYGAVLPRVTQHPRGIQFLR